MASQKQSLPSFASLLSVLSIVFYCAGFLRVELELNEQKKRIIDLENNWENKAPDVPNRDKLTTNTHGKSFLARAENLVYTVDILSGFACSWRRGKETEGEQVTICFLCRE